MTERSRRAGDLADSLLRGVLYDQLDPGYRQAATRRGGGPAAGRAQRAWLLLGGLLMGGLLGVAGVNAASRAPGAEQATRGLVAEVVEARERTEDLGRHSEDLAGEVDRLRTEALAGDARGSRALRHVRRLDLTVAAVPVTGPGLRITVADPPAPPGGGLSREQTVLDRDLQVLLNALWSAGAEAIAVGDVRIGPLATIRQAGAAMLVDNRPVGQPYVFEVVGDPGRLQTELVGTGGYGRFDAFSQLYGTEFDIEPAEQLTLPAARTSRSRLAEPVRPPAPTTEGNS
ncbi:MAG: DUF881 domain-containing protein [Pseudonocardiaceae bacterium]|nr:DUF881 domain-containing protein [Pseudonocardiaceae bacterium]